MKMPSELFKVPALVNYSRWGLISATVRRCQSLSAGADTRLSVFRQSSTNAPKWLGSNFLILCQRVGHPEYGSRLKQPNLGRSPCWWFSPELFGFSPTLLPMPSLSIAIAGHSSAWHSCTRVFSKARVVQVSKKTASTAEEEPSGNAGPTKTVKIYCAKCNEILYRYRKRGKGALVKCFIERIAEDYTDGDMKCKGCGGEFARFRIIKGKPAHKIIGGKVVMRK